MDNYGGSADQLVIMQIVTNSNKGFFDIRGPTLNWVGRRSLDEAKVFFYLIRVNCSGCWGGQG